MDRPSELQMKILEDRNMSDTRQKVIDDFKSANKKLRVIGDLKDKNRVKEQQEMVSEISEDFHTFRTLALMSGIPLKMVYSSCCPPKEKKHKATELARLRKQEFEQFLLQDSISYAHPSKNFALKRFLRDTLEMTRKKYLCQSQYHKFAVISLSTMKMYRPTYILLCGNTPLDQCLCDIREC